LEITNNKSNIYVQIWDTSGAEKYKAITNSHIRNSDGVILVFDVTNRKTFEDLSYWYDLVLSHTSFDIPILLMGNKVDRIDEGFEIMEEEIRKFIVDKNIILYSECSALKNENILEPFNDLYMYVYDNYKDKLRKNFIVSKRSVELRKIPSVEDMDRRCC